MKTSKCEFRILFSKKNIKPKKKNLTWDQIRHTIRLRKDMYVPFGLGIGIEKCRAFFFQKNLDFFHISTIIRFSTICIAMFFLSVFLSIEISRMTLLQLRKN
jgi:hypothetical protein